MPDLAPAEASGLVDEVLERVRVNGAIFLRGEYRTPWAYASPPGADMAAMLAMGDQRLILFHVIAEGKCWLEVEGGPRVELEGGDVVVLPYADQHCMGGPTPAEPTPAHMLLPPQPWHAMPVIRHGGDGQMTQVICGYLLCDQPVFDPLIRGLPAAFRVRPPDGPAAEWFRASVRYALDATRPGPIPPPSVGARVSQLLFVEVLRQYAREQRPEAAGWLAALGDEVVVRALTLLHRDPDRRWTLPELARRAGASRSILDERFRRLLDRSPMRYLAELRLDRAAEMLRNTTASVAEVADRSGYGSEAAFNRAFKRHTGEPPARWRSIRA